MTKFEMKKRYFFSKKIYDERYPMNTSTIWTDFCDGKRVYIINEVDGEIPLHEGQNSMCYLISPQWCEVEEC